LSAATADAVIAAIAKKGTMVPIQVRIVTGSSPACRIRRHRG